MFSPVLVPLLYGFADRISPTRETLENAGEAGWRGKQIGCYIGTWGDDWKELQTRDKLEAGLASVQSHSDFMMANKISFEYDFRGPR